MHFIFARHVETVFGTKIQRSGCTIVRFKSEPTKMLYGCYMLVEGCLKNKNDLKLRMRSIVESWSILYDASDHPFSNCLP